MKYFGIFQSNDDICREFNIAPSELDGAEILVAAYDCENYEGQAFVLFRREGKLYEVNGGHCSCHGLKSQSYYGDYETQWEPELTTPETIAMRHFYVFGSEVKAAIESATVGI